jgi:hypothetical protein
LKNLDSIYFARELPPGDRPPYLTRVCEGDQALRKRVELMLAVSAEAEAFVTDLPEAELEERKPGREPLKTVNSNSPTFPTKSSARKSGVTKFSSAPGGA